MRRLSEAAQAGMKVALGAGAKRPLLFIPVDGPYPRARAVATLGCLAATYMPLEAREDGITGGMAGVTIGLFCNTASEAEAVGGGHNPNRNPNPNPNPNPLPHAVDNTTYNTLSLILT